MPFLESTEPREYPHTSSIMTTIRPAVFTVPPAPKPQSNIGSIPIPDVYAPFPPALHADAAPLARRVNPLRPTAPERRTVSLETADPAQHNQERRELMARREHHRVHHMWSRYYYGNIAEKELYRRYLREGLKQQMSEEMGRKKEAFSGKIKESELAVKKDQDDLSKDSISTRDHNQFLRLYRDANKETMENNQSRRRHMNAFEKECDREVLRYNPINWSGSLT